MSDLGISYRAAARGIGSHASYISDMLNRRRAHPGDALRTRLADWLDQQETNPKEENR